MTWARFIHNLLGRHKWTYLFAGEVVVSRTCGDCDKTEYNGMEFLVT